MRLKLVNAERNPHRIGHLFYFESREGKPFKTQTEYFTRPGDYARWYNLFCGFESAIKKGQEIFLDIDVVTEQMFIDRKIDPTSEFIITLKNKPKEFLPPEYKGKEIKRKDFE